MMKKLTGVVWGGAASGWVTTGGLTRSGIPDLVGAVLKNELNCILIQYVSGEQEWSGSYGGYKSVDDLPCSVCGSG